MLEIKMLLTPKIILTCQQEALDLQHPPTHQARLKFASMMIRAIQFLGQPHALRRVAPASAAGAEAGAH